MKKYFFLPIFLLPILIASNLRNITFVDGTIFSNKWGMTFLLSYWDISSFLTYIGPPITKPQNAKVYRIGPINKFELSNVRETELIEIKNIYSISSRVFMKGVLLSTKPNSWEKDFIISYSEDPYNSQLLELEMIINNKIIENVDKCNFGFILQGYNKSQNYFYGLKGEAILCADWGFYTILKNVTNQSIVKIVLSYDDVFPNKEDSFEVEMFPVYSYSGTFSHEKVFQESIVGKSIYIYASNGRISY